MSKTSSDADWLWEHFVARDDTYAVEVDGGGFIRVDDRLTISVVEDHLRGSKTVGVYQLSKESTVKWICFDIDAKDLGLAKALVAEVSKTVLRNSILVEDTGGRGYHVWVLARGSAAAARALAEELAKPVAPKLAGARVEIFPKQTRVDRDSFGSLVRLPLGVHRKTMLRSVIVYPLDYRSVAPVDIPKSVEDGAARVEEAAEAVVAKGWWTRCPAFVEVKRGVQEGMRNSAAFFLARVYREMGLDPEEVLLLLARWNQRNDPPLPERELRAVVKSAFSRPYRVGYRSVALSDLLSGLCPPSCSVCSYSSLKRALARAIREALESKL